MMPSGIGNTGSAGNVDSSDDTRRRRGGRPGSPTGDSDDGTEDSSADSSDSPGGSSSPASDSGGPEGPGGGVDLGGVAGGSDPSDAPGAGDDGGSSDPRDTSGGAGRGPRNDGGDDDSSSGGGSPGGSSPPPSDVGGPEGTSSSDPADSNQGDASGDSDSSGSNTQPGDEIEGPGGAAPPAQGVEQETPDGQGFTPEERAVSQQAQGLEQQVLDNNPDLSSEDVRIVREERDGQDVLAAELTRTGEATRQEAFEKDPDGPGGSSPPGPTGGGGDDPEVGESAIDDVGIRGIRVNSQQRGGESDPSIEGGDARLAIESTDQSSQQPENTEEFGDIAVNNPLTGNRVEEDLKNAADAFRNEAQGVIRRTGTVGTPVGTAGARPSDEVTDGLQGQVAESTIRLANIPQLASEGKEIGEFAVTQPQRAVTDTDEFISDVTERSTEIAESTATRAEENPAQFAIGTTVGLVGAAGAGRFVGSATRRASGGRVDLGSDLSGRTAQRVSETTRRLGDSTRSATGQAANAVRRRTPEVRVERDPDAGLVEIEGSGPSLPSRPSTPEVTERVSGLRDRVGTDTSITDSARAQAAVAATTARRSASEAADTVRNAPARAQVAASRARRRVSDLPTDARFELSQARSRAQEATSSLVDRSRPSIDRDVDLSRPLSDTNVRQSARVQAAIAASSARRRISEAAPSRPSASLDSPDVDFRQSAAAQAEILASSVRRRASEATQPVRNAPDRARITADRAQRRLGEARADAAFEAAVARDRITDRVPSLSGGNGALSVDAPSLSGARDLTIRIGNSETRRGRVPDDPDTDLGPFADESLGELDRGVDLDGRSSEGPSLTDEPDIDASPGASDGQSAVALERRADSGTPRQSRGYRQARRRDSPGDFERAIASGFVASQFGDTTGPSVGPRAEPRDAVGSDLEDPTAVGPGVETPTDIAPTETPDTGLRTGTGTSTGLTTDTSTGTGLRQDTDVRIDSRVDVRADIESRTDSRRRSDLDIEAPSADGQPGDRLDLGGDEERITADTALDFEL